MNRDRRVTIPATAFQDGSIQPAAVTLPKHLARSNTQTGPGVEVYVCYYKDENNWVTVDAESGNLSVMCNGKLIIPRLTCVQNAAGKEEKVYVMRSAVTGETDEVQKP